MNRTTIRCVQLAISAKVPVLLWGGPGTGKTSTVVALAHAMDLPCEVVIASIREPSDFSGLPVVRDDGVDMVPPRWARNLADQPGVLFLDEVSTAPPAVQAALLRVVLERQVGDVVLHPDTVVVAAANPPESAADGWDLAAPLANRFCHLDWPVDAAVWANGTLSGFTATQHLEATGDDNPPLAAAASTIAAFVQQRPTMLMRQPDDAGAAGRAWPSPRTWTMAAQLLATARAAAADEAIQSTLIASSVGPGAAAEFLAWQNELDLPDPIAVLADPESFQVPERGDRAFAAITSVVGAALDDGSPGAWHAAWLAVAHATKERHADLAVTAVRSLIQGRPDGALPTPDVLRQMAPVLRAAGLFEHLTT